MYVISITLSDENQHHLSVPITGRIVKGSSVVTLNGVPAGGNKVISVKQGNKVIGAIQVQHSSAIGTTDRLELNPDAVEVGPELPVLVTMAGSVAGNVHVSLVIDTFHADN